VLSGCPWLVPRLVFVLTSQQWGWQAADGIQSTYTLRTKVVREGAADAIAQVGVAAGAVIAANQCARFVREQTPAQSGTTNGSLHHHLEQAGTQWTQCAGCCPHCCACIQLLNKQHLAAALEVSEMRDGLVVFESAEDADRFASMLEEEGHSQASARACGGHQAPGRLTHGVARGFSAQT
jgi:hypothetical protein